MTLHRGETPGAAPSHVKLNYGEIFLWILVHLLTLFRLKIHQRHPVQSYLCSWAPSALPVPGRATTGVTAGVPVKPPGSWVLRLCHSHWALWGSQQSKRPICTLVFTQGPGTCEHHSGTQHKHVFCESQVSMVRMVLKVFVQPGKTGSLHCLCFTA